MKKYLTLPTLFIIIVLLAGCGGQTPTQRTASTSTHPTPAQTSELIPEPASESERLSETEPEPGLLSGTDGHTVSAANITADSSDGWAIRSEFVGEWSGNALGAPLDKYLESTGLVLVFWDDEWLSTGVDWRARESYVAFLLRYGSYHHYSHYQEELINNLIAISEMSDYEFNSYFEETELLFLQTPMDEFCSPICAIINREGQMQWLDVVSMARAGEIVNLSVEEHFPLLLIIEIAMHSSNNVFFACLETAYLRPFWPIARTGIAQDPTPTPAQPASPATPPPPPPPGFVFSLLLLLNFPMAICVGS